MSMNKSNQGSIKRSQTHNRRSTVHNGNNRDSSIKRSARDSTFFLSKTSQPSRTQKSVNRSSHRYSVFSDGDDSEENTGTFRASSKRKSVTRHAPATQSLNDRYAVAEELKEVRRTKPKENVSSSGRKSMRTTYTLGHSDEDEFVETLKNLVELDVDLERAKQTLARRNDFTLFDGFRVFDYSSHGFATLDEIMEGFEVFHIYPTREEARLFLMRYDQKKNNELNFDEFCEAFEPLDEDACDVLAKRTEMYPDGYYRRRDEFSASTIDAFARVLKLQIEAEVNAEALRQKHEEDSNFRYDDAFATINKWGEDYLTTEDFEELFRKYGFEATDSELDVLMNRFDKDKDGKVSYDEFFDEFSPHSPLKV